MKFHRIQDPMSLDQGQLSTLFANGVECVVVQFSNSSAYNNEILQSVNTACERFGTRLNVRFYGHDFSEFDCRNLLHLPLVRLLNLDCLTKVAHLEALSELKFLQEFAFAVSEADVPRLLENEALAGVRRLTLGGTRKNNIDLAPLASYGNLANLFVNGHTRHIEDVAGSPNLNRLTLSGIGKRQPLGFIRGMPSLRHLTYLLGGREGVDELAHESLQRLDLVWVRGLRDINLKLFPGLEILNIEKQLQLRTLDISSMPHLRGLRIANCKNLETLRGIESAQSLETLLLASTVIDPESLLRHIPASVKGISINGYGKKKDEILEQRIASLGFSSAGYIPAD
jgi:hypothetical protein